MKKLIKKILKKVLRGTLNELIIGNNVLNDVIATTSNLKISSNYFNDTSQIGASKLAKINPPFLIKNSTINDYSYIAQNSIISFTTIGKFCSIGPNFFCGWGIHPINGVSTSPMFYSTMKQNGMTLSATDKIEERKPIYIGNDVFIGMNVTVLDGVKIGDGAIIGAGAIVSKDIPPYAIAVGNPIKVIKYRFSETQIEELLKIKWWDFDEGDLKEVEKLFFDVESFIKKLS